MESNESTQSTKSTSQMEFTDFTQYTKLTKLQENEIELDEERVATVFGESVDLLNTLLVNGHTETLELLLDNNLVNTYYGGRTFLSRCIANGYVLGVQRLLIAGANPYKKSVDMNSPCRDSFEYFFQYRNQLPTDTENSIKDLLIQFDSKDLYTDQLTKTANKTNTN